MKELMISCILYVFFIAICTDAARLDDYIRHYEELSYSPNTLHQRHLRAKRSLTDPSLVLQFKAFGKNFDLQLERAKNVFSQDFKLQHRNGSKMAVDTSFIYEGRVTGMPGSFVHGAIVEGVFRGFVVVPGDTTYHIEHSRRFFSDEQPFHSVIYSEKHMDMDPYKHKRPEGAGTCGLDMYQDEMEEIATKPLEKHELNLKATLLKQEMEHYRKMYTKEENTVHPETSHRRHRRNTLGPQNTCYMYLRSDPVLWDLYKNKGVSDIVARDEILALFAAHVAAINKIYSETKFSTYERDPSRGGFSYEGVHFQVQRTSIMTKESENCDSILGATSYCNPNIDVSNFLNLNSLENHDEFCLAYVFTARDFTHGTLGLAWVGSYKNAAGGICEKHKDFPEGTTKVSKSLNTGIITLINYGKLVAPRVSHLTFAHEVGHNFGSPHDSGDNCAPYGTTSLDAVSGNFIMYASATQGDLSNNNKFSDCSKDNISRVLNSITNETNKKNCFKQSGVAFCGNGLVEGDEECDCGYLDDCQDKCCHAKKSGETTANDCKLRRDTSGVKHACSPTQGPCCTSNCGFVQQSANQTCRVGTECVKRAICSGASANCPAADNYPDITTFCNSQSRVCKEGVCSESLCKHIGYESRGISEYEECFGTTGSDNKEQMCYLSCQKRNTTDCISSAQITADSPQEDFKVLLNAINGKLDKIKLQAGSPCDNYRGYCDVFHKCRGIDNDGPLARLKNLIFNEKTLQKIKTWIVEYWWAVMMMALCLVVLMGLFIKICAVHTPSSNPKAKPALRITDTLRRRRRPPPQQTYAPSSQPLQSYQQSSAPAGYTNAPPQGPPPPYSATGGGPKRGHRPEEKKNKKAKANERKV
ncbi:disintegrin and metalloproteinase domain-containing protein 10-like isoform X1 [Pecten maximus]|uniref:disintegrin and metalloproteinase domain-containing protein 10-like isoform X1 n=2 Tax=Pecten maximus TaxID=6579 RepID=UPI00145800EE|nr:disintegrin and metalloproteinase domain-containing protein 10-like isoform X1 [Pecten maximus]